MALKLFPTALFSPEGIEADLEKRTVSGGTALNGEEDLIETDGGGRVFMAFENPYLDEPAIALAWRALSAYLDGGARPIIVPYFDLRHQPVNAIALSPHSDATPFADASEYETSGADVTVAADAGLRATTIELAIGSLSRQLFGGEWLSIEHASYGHRMYRIAEVVSQDGDSATITIRPPLREATGAGQAVEFAVPRCVMRLDGDMRSPTSFGFADGTPVRFVEHFPGSEGY